MAAKFLSMVVMIHDMITMLSMIHTMTIAWSSFLTMAVNAGSNGVLGLRLFWKGQLKAWKRVLFLTRMQTSSIPFQNQLPKNLVIPLTYFKPS